MSSKKTIRRSSKSGQFVTPQYEKAHPTTTEKQRVPVGKPGRRGK